MHPTAAAFYAATGIEPQRWAWIALALVCTVALMTLAYVAMKLWEAHQDNALGTTSAKLHAARAAILVTFLIAVLLW